MLQIPNAEGELAGCSQRMWTWKSKKEGDPKLIRKQSQENMRADWLKIVIL